MHIIYKGNQVELEDGANGFIAIKALEPELKKEILAYKVADKVVDLSRVLNEGEEISFITGKEPEGFEIMNHSCSHLMAQALKHLYPGVLFGFGKLKEVSHPWQTGQ